MNRKVVHLTSAHRASDSRIFFRECLALSDAGYEVALLAPGAEEREDAGVQIRGLPRSQSRIERFLLRSPRVLGRALREDGAIYHFHDPDLIAVGLLLRLFGKLVVYDVHEDLSRVLLCKRWIPSPMRRASALIVGHLESFLARGFSAVVAATPWIGARFPIATTVIVRNYPRLEGCVRANHPYRDRQFDLCYVGGISRLRGIVQLMETMAQVRKHHDVCLALAGSFDDPSVEASVKEMPAWQHTRFFGQVSAPQALAIVNASRVGMLVLHATPGHTQSYPLKLFEYMASGIPVVASNFSCWSAVVDKWNCGISVDPTDSTAIADAVEWLLSNPERAEEMGMRGREAVERCFNWETESTTLLRLYDRLLSRRQSGRFSRLGPSCRASRGDSTSDMA